MSVMCAAQNTFNWVLAWEKVIFLNDLNYSKDKMAWGSSSTCWNQPIVKIVGKNIDHAQTNTWKMCHYKHEFDGATWVH